MDKISYTEATIYFREWFNRYKQKFKANAGTFDGRGLSFTRGNYFIQAKIWQYIIPKVFSNDPDIKRRILTPCIESIVEDIKTIEDLFPEFRKFMKVGKLQESIFYKKEPISEGFKLYDYMGSRNGEPFQKLIKFKGIPTQSLKKYYQELPELANSIGQEDGKVAYIQGKTLRESAEKALRVYELSEELKKFI